jgi:hypothetical protein
MYFILQLYEIFLLTNYHSMKWSFAHIYNIYRTQKYWFQNIVNYFIMSFQFENFIKSFIKFFHLNSKLMWTLFKYCLKRCFMLKILPHFSQINLKLKSVLSLLWIDFFSFLNKMINCWHIYLFIDFENWQNVILYYNLSEKELMKVWSNLRIGPKFKLYHDLDHTNSYLLLSHLACWICITF